MLSVSVDSHEQKFNMVSIRSTTYCQYNMLSADDKLLTVFVWNIEKLTLNWINVSYKLFNPSWKLLL